MSWPDHRLTELFRIEHPIVQAPMAGAMDHTLAVEVAKAGGLGSLPAAMLDTDRIRSEMAKFRAATGKPVNLNFFCHSAPVPNNAREAAWRERLMPYYREWGVDPAAPPPPGGSRAFDASLLELVLELKPDIVSFQFGLPPVAQVEAIKRAGLTVIGA